MISTIFRGLDEKPQALATERISTLQSSALPQKSPLHHKTSCAVHQNPSNSRTEYQSENETPFPSEK